MKYNFPHEVRLTTEAQFKQVFSRAKQKITTKVFAVYFCYNNVIHPRLGVIIPKKNVNKASKRNYFKRIVREYFRLNQNKLKKIDVVIFFNKKIDGLAKEELNQQLEIQFNKLAV